MLSYVRKTVPLYHQENQHLVLLNSLVIQKMPVVDNFMSLLSRVHLHVVLS